MARIDPGATIGIIGGGQLGRMLAIAAARLGYRTHIFTPEADSPAQQVASQTTIAAYDDAQALAAFAGAVDVVTYEFENIPHASLTLLERTVAVSPSADILRLSQNRVREKAMLNAHGIATAPWRAVRSAEDAIAAAAELGVPGVLKTAELGYDGKGQAMVQPDTDLAAAWETLHADEAVYEGFIHFECEISVIVARNEMSGCVAFPAVQNIHVHHILDTTIAPAPIDKAIRKQAEAIAKSIAEALDLCGILAVEMFVSREGDVVVNELAPRPHNSGHWTIDACVTSQFEQAIRAICGLPLGSPRRLYDAVMKNLVGEDVHQWYDYLQDPNTKVHLYGKKEVREGRKMGHVTRLGKKAKPSRKFQWMLP